MADAQCNNELFKDVWAVLRQEVSLRIEAEQILTSFFHTTVLEHEHTGEVLVDLLSLKLATEVVPAMMLRRVLTDPFSCPDILYQSTIDMIAYYVRDPACHYFSTPLLFYKGFQAVQAYRAANFHWKKGRHSLALFLHNRISEVFGVDIHPGAVVGMGLMLDHATGVVIGETAEVGDFVSMYHNVLLGWNGKDAGKRHPTIKDNVLLSSGCSVIGNIVVNKDSQIAAGAVVLEEVPSGITVAGIPAKTVGAPNTRSWKKSIEEAIDQDYSNGKDKEITILHDEILRKHIL